MIEFWLCAGLLLLTALAFLLLPVVRGRGVQAEEDRTALNVTLYQERLRELQSQRDAGVLSEAQYSSGRDEAARELLADTEGAESKSRVGVLGATVPLIMALAMPLLGYGLYMHWGAIDQVERAQTLAAQPKSIEEMTARLEESVKSNPESAEGWYFLGRTYMAQERSAEAASAFEKAVALAGREPELLGQWAQALYFAGDKQWTPQLKALTDEALKADPAEVTSLGLLGIVAYESEQFAAAIDYWEQLVAALPEQDPSRMAIQGGIARARERLAPASAEQAPQAEAAALRVRVELGDAVRAQVQPGDSVFVFARALSGPPMPLAVKRLSVAELPAEVSLSDADAMMPQLKLSGFPQVELVARISRSGDATRGEWVGRSEPLTSDAGQAPTLIIDTADTP
ncbi:MAG: c-type cytochrome biogenesis protein CcmI [Gammaproteobacteria bacterium]|nr:c-type cytochrome biogenesis protein CcmI [Gammaproteobacteria bacterium]MBU1490349.1 c-type cytochrome biogenesis protein CcmI [Gammaproteobacteria bacterium]MBU2064652.1 c-type cytochrome biogenesis protein CcmI [Gammaproteobacteria bacterium]MBU2138650.1 c-type cytochrome biogenesis protein CcmI [Gammaproteobacteria bacterium]MBU2217002.1 c-type cytochrome biogenesis protein CcmI [Gammaproteobacteria bacterium]